MAAGAKAMSTVSKRMISDAHLLDDAMYEDESREISALLGSTISSQKLEGLKRLIACISVGRDVSDFFPKVVVNVAHVPFEVKNLVYIFLVRYAERKPDEALLSINTFQKDLSDQNPRIRALALRVMSSIRIHATVPIVILAIKKCALDPSVYVRKAAAHAVPKVHQLDHTVADQLMELIELILGDRTPLVIASAIAAFLAVCPERLDLLHVHFRKLCRMMVDVEEWGQVLMANLLLRYARTQFCRPDNNTRDRGLEDTSVPYASGAMPEERPVEEMEAEKFNNMLAQSKNFYSDSDDDDDDKQDKGKGKDTVSKKLEADDEEDSGDEDMEDDKPAAVPAVAAGKEKSTNKDKGKGKSQGGAGVLADDHALLLRCSRPLLQSRNSAVVVGVACLHFYLAPFNELAKVASALLFTLRTSTPESQQVIIATIANIVGIHPSIFAPHMFQFYLKTQDSYQVRLLKLEILTTLVNTQSANINLLLQELQVYLRDLDKRTVVATIRALGRCASRLPSTASACIRSLVALTNTGDEEVAAEAVVVIRTLVQQQPRSHGAVIIRLLRTIDHIKPPIARAAVVWMAGGDFGQGPETGMAVLAPEHALKLDQLAPEVLRRVAATFVEETSATKLQLITSVTKQRLTQPGNAQLAALHRYVISVARYDQDYDVRDRARYLRMLVPPEGDDVTPSALSAHSQAILLCSKPHPPLPTLAEFRCNYTMGTLSFMVQHAAPAYFALAPHPLRPSDPSIRDPPVAKLNLGRGGSAPKNTGSRRGGENKGCKDSDSFYDSDESGTGSSSSGRSSGSRSGSFYSRSDNGSGSSSGSESGNDQDDSDDTKSTSDADKRSESGSASGSENEDDSDKGSAQSEDEE